MKNKFYAKASLLITSAFMLIASSHLHAHPGHEHDFDLIYMISHSLAHSGLFILAVGIIVSVIIFSARKYLRKKNDS